MKFSFRLGLGLGIVCLYTTLFKKKSEFSLYFHFLGSDVRDHLFRSENRLILESL